MEDAIGVINRKIASVLDRKAALEQKNRRAIAQKGAERISAAEHRRSKVETKLHEALVELTAQKEDLAESKDVMDSFQAPDDNKVQGLLYGLLQELPRGPL